MADRFDVATRKGLFRFENTGGRWQAGPPQFLGEPVSAVMRDPRDDTVYVALNHGHFGAKFHRSDDGGANFSELEVPKYPEGGEAALDFIWCFAAGPADRPGQIWAGTLPGGLFRSDDRGETWALVRNLWDQPAREKWFGGGFDKPGIHSILIDPRDPARMTIAVSCGGVWQSADRGETWVQAGHGLRAEFLPPDLAYDPVMQDPHLLAACAGAPDHVWCQHHNGIFSSRDGGATFTEHRDVAPAVFGFAVAVHPGDPKTAWFVPGVKDECRVPVDGKLVVTRTRDGGESFEILSKGLPEPGYDIVLRHGLDVDASGARLVMGSSTGTLWVSGDGGESWDLVSHALPPIAQVAFF